MGWWQWLQRRVEVVFRKQDAEAELDDEIRAHIEMEIQDNIRSGMAPEDAVREARRNFGGVERFKEEVRDVRGARLLDDLIQDSRVALRSLAKQPAFLLAVVVTLAVGIGGSVAMFAVLDASLLKALPFPESERLLLGRSTFDGRLGPVVSGHDFEDYRERVTSFAALGAIAPFPSRLTLTGRGEAERLDRIAVSYDFFRALGVDPLLGRPFLKEEAEPGAARVVMLSHGYWQRRFAQDPGILGATLVLNSVAHTVVGIMPQDFRFYLDTDVWTPYRLGSGFAATRGAHNFLLVARLGDGVPLARARSEVDVVSAELAEAYPGTNEGKGLQITPLQNSLAERYVPVLAVLTVAAILILLVACANVAGLLLARGNARRGEMALRSAMGAGGGRLARQLLTESGWMAAMAGVLGIALGYVVQSVVLGFLSLDTLGEFDAGLNPRTLGFAVVVSAASVLIAGLLPSLRAARTDLVPDLKGTRVAGHTGTTRLRSTMVVTQIALTSVLLGVSGLLLRSFVELQRVDLGFDDTGLLTAEIQIPNSYDAAARGLFLTELKTRIEATPGATSVALASHIPIRDPGNTMGIRRIVAGGDEVSMTISQRMVMPGYFADMGIPLLRGRGVEAADDATSAAVIVLSESVARALFGEEDPVGRDVDAANAQFELAPRRVVGVVADVIMSDPRSGDGRAMYLPLAQRPRSRVRLAVRADAAPALLTGPIREILTAMDPNVPLDDVRTMESIITGSVQSQRVLAAVIAVFALTALVLAAVGLYGVLAYQVSLRLHEIGIRMALGASARNITRGIVRGGLTLVLIGFAAGGVATVAAGRLIQGLLFGVGSFDPLTFAALGVVLVTVGSLACFLPARRAAAVNPTKAMRAD